MFWVARSYYFTARWLSSLIVKHCFAMHCSSSLPFVYWCLKKAIIYLEGAFMNSIINAWFAECQEKTLDDLGLKRQCASTCWYKRLYIKVFTACPLPPTSHCQLLSKQLLNIDIVWTLWLYRPIVIVLVEFQRFMYVTIPTCVHFLEPSWNLSTIDFHFKVVRQLLQSNQWHHPCWNQQLCILRNAYMLF